MCRLGGFGTTLLALRKRSYALTNLAQIRPLNGSSLHSAENSLLSGKSDCNTKFPACGAKSSLTHSPLPHFHTRPCTPSHKSTARKFCLHDSLYTPFTSSPLSINLDIVKYSTLMPQSEGYRTNKFSSTFYLHIFLILFP